MASLLSSLMAFGLTCTILTLTLTLPPYYGVHAQGQTEVLEVKPIEDSPYTMQGFIYCFYCMPEGREIGQLGEVWIRENSRRDNKFRGKLYDRKKCTDFAKAATERGRRNYRFVKICKDGCIYGKTESIYRGTAEFERKIVEEKFVSMWGSFKGCMGPIHRISGAMRIDSCINLKPMVEPELRRVHPEDDEVFIRTNGHYGEHTLCACRTSYCNKGSKRRLKPSFEFLVILALQAIMELTSISVIIYMHL